MPKAIIRTSVYPTGECISTGYYYDDKQTLKQWEYIGEFSDLDYSLYLMRENEGCEIQHVVNRHIT